MKALTLWPPWSWVVAVGIKPIENRSWPPPAKIVGEQIAIHAGKHWDTEGERFIRERVKTELIPSKKEIVRGAIVAVATVTKVIRHDQTAPPALIRDEMFLTESEKVWFFGPYGWILRGVFCLPQPVPCRGYQMLWTVPDREEERVRKQLEHRHQARHVDEFSQT